MRNFTISSRRKRGQALVEFALIIPLFVATFFSIFEVALIWGANALAHQATERAVHAIAVAGSTITDEQQIASTIVNQINGYVVAQVMRVDVYSTGAGGGDPSALSDDQYDGSGNVLQATYPVSSRISTLANPQYLAVRVTFQYTWLSSFIGVTGATLTLKETSTAMILSEGG